VNEEMQMVGAKQFIGYGTQGYVLTQKGAEFLLKNCYTLVAPIDLQIRHLCNTANISASVVFPPYVRRNHNRLSSIGMNVDDVNDLNKKQNQQSIIQRLLTNLMQLNLNLDDFV
jgi:GR25 family glycosyltransferase involved in LPS biosynthesis